MQAIDNPSEAVYVLVVGKGNEIVESENDSSTYSQLQTTTPTPNMSTIKSRIQKDNTMKKRSPNAKVPKTFAEQRKEARQKAFADTTTAMTTEFKRREKKALELEKEMDKHEAAVSKQKAASSKLGRKATAESNKAAAAQRRLDAMKRKMEREIEKLQRAVDAAQKKAVAACSAVDANEKKIAAAPEKAKRLQKRIDAAFNAKNLIEDRISKRVKPPKEYDLSKK